MQFILCLLSIALTIVCWGVYGPVLHWGQEAMHHGRLRPLICVGIAYFIIAVVIPFVVMSGGVERDKPWTMLGTMWSLVAGSAGAIGALGIILALSYGGRPSWVMPLVFGGAPVVNTALTITVSRQWGQVSPFYLAGLLLVGVGAVTILAFKPAPPKSATTPPARTTPAPATSPAPAPTNTPASTPAPASTTAPAPAPSTSPTTSTASTPTSPAPSSSSAETASAESTAPPEGDGI